MSLDLRSLHREALSALIAELGEKPYRTQQILRWLHLRGVRAIDEMTDLSKALREALSERAHIGSLTEERVEVSQDGTRKFAWCTTSGEVVESVFIPDVGAGEDRTSKPAFGTSAPRREPKTGRNTLCISSQVGCALGCTFCFTASLGLVRNLTAGEIIEQITRVKAALDEEEGTQAQDRPTIGNVVLMGMGEPLQNFENVVEALAILSSPESHHISPRRITVSTSGVVPKIPQLGEAITVNLAISLNATTDEVRDRIMPINRRWNLNALINACKEFPLPARRRITFEYVLLKGINDTDEDARRLVRLLRPIRCKVNLIPFNPHPESPYEPPAEKRVLRFQQIVQEGRLTTMLRTPRGQDIHAACGQLGKTQ